MLNDLVVYCVWGFDFFFHCWVFMSNGLVFLSNVWVSKNQALGRSYLLALLFFSIGFRDF